MILSPDASRRLQSFDGSDRHIVAKFGFAMFIGVYAPTSIHYNQREAFFTMLSSIMPRESVQVFLLGDFNSRMFAQHSSRVLIAAKSQFQDFLDRHQLLFPKPNGPTFSSNGHSAILDYVLCRSRFRSSICRVRVLSNSPISSDHFPVVATLKVHFASEQFTELNHKPDFSVLQSDAAQKQKFLSHFSAVSSYESFADAFNRASLSLSTTKDNAMKRTWKTDLAFSLLEMDEQLGTHSSPGLLLEQDIAQATKLVQLYSSQLRDHPRLAWKHILRCASTPPTTMFPASTPVERMEVLTRHFSSLFTNESHTGPPQWGVSAIIPTFVTGPFTKDEVHGVLGTGKSPGCDGIPNEVLKIAELEDTMLRIMNQALVEVPGDWKRTVLVPLPQKRRLVTAG